MVLFLKNGECAVGNLPTFFPRCFSKEGINLPMRYFALATDYDGTLATQGKVEEGVLETLAQLKASGRRLVMVTGRELDDLQRTFSHLDMFERIVAENGALVYNPATHEEKIL